MLFIERDVNWWDGDAVPKINKYWQDVLEHRSKPMKKFKNFINLEVGRNHKGRTKIDKFIETKKKVNNGFLTDSDDED